MQEEADEAAVRRKKWTIDKLDAVVFNAAGKPVAYVDGEGETEMTLKDGLVAQLQHHSCGAVEAIKIFLLAEKVRGSSGEVVLDEHEHALMKKIVEANPAKLFAVVLAQVYRPFA